MGKLNSKAGSTAATAAERHNTASALEEAQKATYTKGQILSSKKYYDCKDLLEAVLENRQYTIGEVEQTIQNFMKGRG